MRWVLGLVVSVAIGALAPGAQAAFPGQNGRIAFAGYQGQWDVYTMNPDGSDLQNLTNDATDDMHPAWSPDGKKIAFARGGQIYVMNPDGSGLGPLDHPQAGSNPAWSPDGTKLAFGNTDVFTVNSDGTGLANLTDDNPLQDADPAWSPDGAKIAFSRTIDDEGYSREVGFLYTMSADGTGKAAVQYGYSGPPGSGCGILWNDAPNWAPDGTAIGYHGVYDYDGDWCVSIESVKPDGSGRVLFANAPGAQNYHHFNGPAWSPDGTRIVYGAQVNYQQRMVVADRDGSNTVPVGPSSIFALDPDWQPLPVAGFPRPKSASRIHMSLVPAYLPCTSVNRTHGPPLAFGSCSPPEQSSTYLTVGTPDTNGSAAKSTAYVRLDVQLGNPATAADEADVAFYLTATDVRLASDLSDYTGALQAVPTLRMTDKDNAPNPGGPGPGTVTDFMMPFAAQCAPTSDATVGSTCTAATSADALAPGAVKEKRRAIWQLERFEVGDGGPQASPANRPFLVPGLFVP